MGRKTIVIHVYRCDQGHEEQTHVPGVDPEIASSGPSPYGICDVVLERPATGGFIICGAKRWHTVKNDPPTIAGDLLGGPLAGPCR